jgi:hypothetical protein
MEEERKGERIIVQTIHSKTGLLAQFDIPPTEWLKELLVSR